MTQAEDGANLPVVQFPPIGCQNRGYVARDAAPLDARRKRLQVIARGFAVLRDGEAIFGEMRDQWARQLGSAELEAFEKHLSRLVGPSPKPLTICPAGWRKVWTSAPASPQLLSGSG